MPQVHDGESVCGSCSWVLQFALNRLEALGLGSYYTAQDGGIVEIIGG
jgi:hypothetical protein